MRRQIMALVAIAAGVLLLLSACGGSETHTIHGRLRLDDNGGSGVLFLADSCQGASGYSDIGSWTQVKVTNESGKILGVTSLGQGSGRVVCDFTFSVDVDEAHYYTITIGSGRRGDITMSKSQLEANGWNVNVTLGL